MLGRLLRRPTAVTMTALLGGLSLLLLSPARADSTTNEVYTPAADGTFAIEGHGWGHGHGMSQYGAQGAATKGLTADAITAFYYPGTSRALLAAAPIRVQLAADEGKDTQVYAATGLRVTAGTGSSSLPSGPTRWRVVVDAAGLHLESLTGSTWSAPVAVGGTTSFSGPVSFSGPTGSLVRLAYPDGTSRDYRGAVQAVQLTSSTLASVDVLSLEDYLLGVVPREASSSWLPAALQAQAIAARSYSAYKRGHTASTAKWDICDSTYCQTFGGSASYTAAGLRTSLEPTSTTDAVHATTGVARTYGGQPIFAEFSSSDGGWSVDGGEAYLKAQPDDYDGITNSSVHSWTATLTTTQLTARFPTVGRLLRMRVTSRDGNGEWGGRVQTVVLEGVSASGAATSVPTTGVGVYLAHSWPTSPDGLRSSWWHVKRTAPATRDDYNGDGTSDVAAWRPSNATWYVRGQSTTQWGVKGDVPVPGDYNGDRRTDLAVWHPSTGTWSIRGQATVQWGVSGDIPVPGDYNGDGRTDLAVWRPSNATWYVRGQSTTQWGMANDIPVVGDYNGDGRADLAVWRPSTGTWSIRGQATLQWGLTGDIPVPGDDNGDGTTDLAVWRPSNATWYVRGQSTTQWGATNDIPVVGDYNGDGRTDLVIWRPSTGTWWIRGQATTPWGLAGDQPLGATVHN